MRTSWPARDEGGFVMVMVVLLLFAIAVAGATGYQLVAIEADLASGTEESQTALAAARAGLQRFAGEHFGVPADTTTYVIGDADVYVIAKRLVGYDSLTVPDLYLLKAVAELADPRHPDAPATRVVQQYARLNKKPINVTAALMTVAGTVTTNDSVRGADHAPVSARGYTLDRSTGACQASGSSTSVNGVVQLTAGTGGTIAPTGTLARQQVSTAPLVVELADVRWSAVEDPSFPIPYTGSWPSFGSLPSDSFPVVRMSGGLTVSGNISGRGVLIVPGTFQVSGFGASFQWDGIVLAGAIASPMVTGFLASMRVDGAIVGGLDAGAQATLSTKSTGFLGALNSKVYYDSCNVAKANRSLAYFTLVDNTRWEF